MIEERLVAIEARLDALETGQQGLAVEMRALNDATREEMRTLNEETRKEARALNDETRQEMRALNEETRREMRALNETTQRQMRVLFEEVIDRIAAAAPDLKQIERAYIAADSELREDINRRLDPIERWIQTRGRRRRKK